VLIEISDVVFAVDSIPAIFAVTQQPFLVFTSNAFAVLGLRAMYFLLADLMHRFVYLKLGLALVLVWVGVKMLLLEVYKIPTALSLAVVGLILGTAIAAGLIRTRVNA
jgi:tellurite resistance protein TerC